MLEQGAILMSFITSLTPLLEIEDIKKSQTVLERNCLSYASMWLCYALWAIYGLVLGNLYPIALPNIWGVVASSYYCAVFYQHVSSRMEKVRVGTTYGFTLALAIIVLIYCKLEAHPREVVEGRIGFVASLVSVLMMASPLSLIPVVLENGTHLLNFHLLVMYNITSAMWCVYGIVVKDNFVAVTNLIGGMICFISLLLFAFIPPYYKTDFDLS